MDSLLKIEALLTQYNEGLYFGDIQKLRSCFASNTTLYGDIQDKLYIKALPDYLKSVSERQSPFDLKEDNKIKIIGIELLGKIATAKLHVPILGYNYYDYISMAYIDNHWKIVNKLYKHEG